MKLFRGGPFERNGGFTLPELLVAISIFLLLISGIISAHLFGLSMFRITETKLNATADARKVIGKMANEIRTCTSTKVGNINSGSFVGKLDGEKQEGSGLMIYPTTNAANFILYFVNPSDRTFRRTTSTPGSAVILAESVTNSVLFSARNYVGTVLTNSQNNRVIHLNLEFYHSPRFGQPADYYKLETSVTRRALKLL
ncbi:MAG: type II secretion system protein [Verrucomicrobia bacterium]|nr:type II secretion system protein [Verrucomicrobiota bacterium]